MSIHPVHLGDMSKNVMSKLRNGHSVRASLGAKGSGVPAFLSEDNIKKLMKAGKKGGKAVIKLGAEELAKNRTEGSGIMAGGKLKMGGMKDFKKGFSKGFNAMGGVDGIVDAGLTMAGGKLKMGKLKDFGHGFSQGFNAMGGVDGIVDAGLAMAGEGMYAGAKGGSVDGGSVGKIKENIAKAAVKKVSGGKIKMKSVTGAIKKIAGNKHVQDAALDLAKSAMGSGMAEGGKLKMKHLTGAISSIAGNKHVQNAAIDALKSMAGGEGMFAGARGDGMFAGARGGDVKRKVVDLIEDIGEDKPRKKGESRVREAIDLVEKMRKPRGGAVTRSQAAAERKKHCHDAGYHLQECVKGKRGRKPAGGSGIFAGGKGVFAGGKGMFAGARGGAIGPHGENSPITNVGAGGSMMCLSNPALRPQPYSENFFFHTQFPPALAERM